LKLALVDKYTGRLVWFVTLVLPKDGRQSIILLLSFILLPAPSPFPLLYVSPVFPFFKWGTARFPFPLPLLETRPLPSLFLKTCSKHHSPYPHQTSRRRRTWLRCRIWLACPWPIRDAVCAVDVCVSLVFPGALGRVFLGAEG
jgi:hypothetical protein